MNTAQKYIIQLLSWRIRRISHKHFLILLSALLGLIVGGFAVLIKYIIHHSYEIVANFKSDQSAFLLFFFPLIGIFLTQVLANRIFKESIGHGVTKVLYQISKGSSNLKKRNTISSVSTAIVTILFGGSVGLEAPLVTSGSAFGSNVGQFMRLHYKSRTLLIGCGTAAAISGIFNSPITGVIFAIEVILTEITIEKFIPIVIASVCGSIFPMIFSQNDSLFNFVLSYGFSTQDIPFYAVLGVVCGLIALTFTRTHFYIEEKLNNIEKQHKRMLIGGLALCLLIFIFPPLYGEGYSVIKQLFYGNEDVLLNRSIVFKHISTNLSIPLILLFMIFAKAFASSCTLGAGGSGGIFAPSLFVGGLTGYLFSRTSNQWDFTHDLNVGNFTLVGMSGIISGVLHAPLTGVFLIAEITGGYILFVPLMIVSAIAYTTISIFEPHSIYTKHLIENGDLIQGNKDKELLSLIDRKKLITNDYIIINPDKTISEILVHVKESDKIIFPVLDDNQKLLGVVNWEDIKNVIFNTQLADKVKIKTVMHSEKILISSIDTTEDIMKKFEKSNKLCLPVINQEGQFDGFIYKDTLYKLYRDRLIKQYETEA